MSDSSYGDLLVSLDQYYRVGERSGPGYDRGRYNMTNDYSLIIHDVSVEDEGTYICEVSDFETGRVFRNYTNVTVTGMCYSADINLINISYISCQGNNWLCTSTFY